jgi:uncharacterized membrane protein (DUF485 family)
MEPRSLPADLLGEIARTIEPSTPPDTGGQKVSSSIYQRIRVNPKFRALEVQRSRLAWLLSAIVLAAYYGLMIVVAFWPSALHAPLSVGGVVTIGVPIAAAVIVLSWLLTGLYVYRANTTFDELNEQILSEARQ